MTARSHLPGAPGVALDGPGVRRVAGRLVRAVVLSMAALSVLAAAAAVLLPVATGAGAPVRSLATSGVLFTLVGALVVRRQPAHRLGPLLVAIGVLGTCGALSEAFTTAAYGVEPRAVPGAVWAGWFGDWYWLALLWLQLVALPLLFPDGRLPSPRWRWFARVAATLGTLQVAIAMGSQQLMLDAVQLGGEDAGARSLWLDNPLGIVPVRNFEADLGWTVPFVAVCIVAATASLVGRYQAAGVVERRQVKVAIAGVALNAVGFVLVGVVNALFGAPGGLDVVEYLLFLLVPISLGVAIMRYRLYDIDRVLSRTVAWLLVSAALLAVYLGGVVVLQSLLQPLVGEGDLPVALATLGAAALARPLLRGVQRAVDRRFNRAHYDAARTVDEFARGLRDEVSRDAIVADLADVTHATFQPRVVGVHLLTGEEG